MDSKKIKVGVIRCTELSEGDENWGFNETATLITPWGFPDGIMMDGKVNSVPTVLIKRRAKDIELTPSNINYKANLWAMKQAGCTHILAGAVRSFYLKRKYDIGDFMVPDSFINGSSRQSTYFDRTADAPKGVCYLSSEPAFDQRTRNILIQSAREICGLPIRANGTAMIIDGPRCTSRSESMLYRSWGADFVNMHIYPECILAKELGMLYACIAAGLSYDTWIKEIPSTQELRPQELKLQLVLKKIFTVALPKIAKEEWKETITSLEKTIENACILPVKKKELKKKIIGNELDELQTSTQE